MIRCLKALTHFKRGNQVNQMMLHHGVRHQQVYKMVQVAKTIWKYRPRFKADTAVIDALEVTVNSYPPIIFCQIHFQLG